jgi:phosphatidylserine/phosphatidylglycerophosphate/cardiolipin synthase-like enzyme
MTFPPDVPLLAAERTELLWARDLMAATMTTLEAARTRIDVAMFIVGVGTATAAQDRVRDLLDVVVRARYCGVECRVLINDFAGDATQPTLNLLAAHYLVDGGVAVRRYTSDRHRSMHSKYLLVDDAIAIVGGGNWTPGGLTANLEATVRVVSAPLVRVLRRRFDADWSTALDVEALG